MKIKTAAITRIETPAILNGRYCPCGKSIAAEIMEINVSEASHAKIFGAAMFYCFQYG